MTPDEQQRIDAIRERHAKLGKLERYNWIGHAGGLRRVRGSKGVEGPLIECKDDVTTATSGLESRPTVIVG